LGKKKHTAIADLKSEEKKKITKENALRKYFPKSEKVYQKVH
jgi:hypothetical protein